MKKFSKVTTFLILTFSLWINLQAQENAFESVRAELQHMTEMEQQAFITGDCEKVISLMDDNITFFANGRKAPSKMMIQNFCENIPRPFEKPSSNNSEYYALTENSGYVIRIIEFSNDEVVYKKEIVTKIWKKDESGWKIKHLHSTVKVIVQ